MRHISEFTPKNLRAFFEDFDADEGISQELVSDLICLRFRTFTWREERRPKAPQASVRRASSVQDYNGQPSAQIQRRTSDCDVRCRHRPSEPLWFELNIVRASPPKRIVKRFFQHAKFFHGESGLFLGDSLQSALRELLRLGVAEFVAGRHKRALHYFRGVYDSAEAGCEEERQSDELIDVTKAVVGAERELKNSNFNGFVERMTEAHAMCSNDVLRAVIAAKSNCEAEAFSKKAEELFRERNFEAASEFYRLALEADSIS